MPEIAYVAPPPRAELREALKRRVGDHDPALRILAEDVLGAGSAIDLVAAGPDGRVVLILIGETAGDDLALFTRGLAQCAWVEPRVRDWLKLAPALGVQPDARVGLSLLCPSFSPETIAAAEALCDETIELATYRCVRNGAATAVLVEHLAGRQLPAGGASTPRAPKPFRSGLTAEDLNLTPEEIRDFD